MRSNHAMGIVLPNLPRRRFARGLAVGGTTTGLGLGGMPTRASQTQGTAFSTASVLRGIEFDLVIAGTPVNFTGKPGMVTTINGMLPGSASRWREGDTVTTQVTNRLPGPASIY